MRNFFFFLVYFLIIGCCCFFIPLFLVGFLVGGLTESYNQWLIQVTKALVQLAAGGGRKEIFALCTSLCLNSVNSFPQWSPNDKVSWLKFEPT